MRHPWKLRANLSVLSRSCYARLHRVESRESPNRFALKLVNSVGTLGIVEGYLLLVVAHTVRDDEEDGQPIEIIRIISARAADRRERRRYEQEIR